jgi:drug/metabolite transporter (DMT)-like permease
MGNILMLISSFCFAISSYFGRIVSTTSSMSSTITSFSRFLFGTVFIGAYLLYKKQTFKSKNYKTVFIRALLNCASIILFAWCLNYTTITNANMLNMIYPVFVIILAPLISKENIKKSTYIYLILVIIGSYAISNPGFNNINLGDFIALSTALITALSVFALKKAIEYDDGNLVVFYVMLIGTFVDIPFVYKDLTNFDINGLLPVILSALFGVFGQLTQIWSYETLDSATGSLISSSRIIMSAVIGYLLLAEPLNLRIIFGIILVTISLVGVSGYIEKIRERKEAKNEINNLTN